MISVVVPLYNYAKYIEENILSIKSQSYSNWEIIIVDDCSNDNPASIINKHVCDKIKYIKLDKNMGYSAAKNTGIKASAGKYIVVLDADDMLSPRSLESRIKHLKLKNKKWVHAKAYEFSGRPPYKFRFRKRPFILRLNSIIKNKKYKDLWNNMHAQTVMVHRSVYKKVGLYEEKLRTMGDKEMWARILHNVEVPAYLNKFVAYYRQHSGQMHRSKEKLKNLQRYKSRMTALVVGRKHGKIKGVDFLK